MPIIALHNIENIEANTKLHKAYLQLNELLQELQAKQLEPATITIINDSVQLLNAQIQSNTLQAKYVKLKQGFIIKHLEKAHKIVPKNYYRNMWMMLGMSSFGLPIGVAFGLSLKNIGLLGLGLPIGMGIGVAVGSKMDAKAKTEGRQLNSEISN